MNKKFKAIITSEDGATAIEYGLLVTLIALAAVGGMTRLGESLTTMFTDASTTVAGDEDSDNQNCTFDVAYTDENGNTAYHTLPCH